MNLILISLAAFIYVFLVLSIIAVLMRIIVKIYSNLKPDDSVAQLAAVASVLRLQYPGTRITKIEESK